MGEVVRAVVVGLAVALAGTLPRNALFAANLRYWNEVPWAVPVTAFYLILFWLYLSGRGPPAETSEYRRESLRANHIPVRMWFFSLLAGALSIVALVFALELSNRLVALPQQALPDLSGVPARTVLALLLAAGPIAGLVEEAAFRGYMQQPIERRYGVLVAILITGTAFAVAHLDFTLALWPYYVAVAAIYGAVTHYSNSILPAIALHTGGNLYSNLDLWLHGRAEWQAPARAKPLVWESGFDAAFFETAGALIVFGAAALMAFRRLRAAATKEGGPRPTL